MPPKGARRVRANDNDQQQQQGRPDNDADPARQVRQNPPAQQQQQQNVNNQQQQAPANGNRRPPGPGRQAGGRLIQARNWVFTLWRAMPPLGHPPPRLGRPAQFALEHEPPPAHDRAFYQAVPPRVPPPARRRDDDEDEYAYESDPEPEPEEEPGPDDDEQEPDPEQPPQNNDFLRLDRPELPGHLDYIVYQQERGRHPGARQGGYHWQGYLEFSERLTLQQVLREMGWSGDECHLEPRMGTQKQAIDYVTKEDTRIEGTTREFGEKHADDAAGGWAAAVDDIRQGANFAEMVQAHTRIAIQCHAGIQKAINALAPTPTWRSVETFVLWGGTGAGKTRGVYEREGHHHVYTKMCSKAGSVQWFDGYGGEPGLLLDEFKCQYDLQELLRWLDGHPLRVEMKGSHTIAKWSRVYICSNKDPKEWYSSATPEERAALWRRIPEDHIYKVVKGEPIGWPPLLSNESEAQSRSESTMGSRRSRSPRISSVASSLARDPQSYHWQHSEDGMFLHASNSNSSINNNWRSASRSSLPSRQPAM